MKEFIIIPLLFIIYFYAVGLFTSPTFANLFSAFTQTFTGEQISGTQVVGIGATASIAVTRGYLFGFYRLPVFTSSLGDISIYHNIFFVSVFLITTFLIYRKVKLRNRYTWQHTTHL
jgi:hypothetical protein